MKAKNRVALFIADELNPSFKKSFDGTQFKILNLTNLTNQELLSRLHSIKENKIVLVIRTIRNIDRKFISNAPNNLKLICTASSGYNNIDCFSARKCNIDAMNVPDASFISAAEHAWSMMLTVSKNLFGADVLMKKKIFDFSGFSNTELHGKTIGIIGVGKVGSHVAKIAKAFGMKVLGNDINTELESKYRWIKFVSLNNLLKQSDVISVHTPLDDSTRNLLHKNNLSLIKSSSLIINCARGEIIDERDLIGLLKSNKNLFACLDVFENEPDFNKEFAKLKNVLLSPHLAGKTIESKERFSFKLAKQIKDYIKKNDRSKLVN